MFSIHRKLFLALKKGLVNQKSLLLRLPPAGNKIYPASKTSNLPPLPNPYHYLENPEYGVQTWVLSIFDDTFNRKKLSLTLNIKHNSTILKKRKT